MKQIVQKKKLDGGELQSTLELNGKIYPRAVKQESNEIIITLKFKIAALIIKSML